MEAAPAAVAIAAHVVACAEGDDRLHKYLRSVAPPIRAVDIRIATWLPWLCDGGRPGTASYVGPLPAERVAAVGRATAAMTETDPGHLVVERSHLFELSARAAKGHQRALVSLWVATMMWGSGTTNGRGPWRTAQALADPSLGDTLVASQRHLRAGDLAEAYVVASAVEGAGEAYFTRWLWAVSLGLDLTELRPLTLDDPIREAVMGVLGRADADDQVLGGGVNAYLTYVTAVNEAARVVRREHGYRGATPEKLECVLRELA